MSLNALNFTKPPQVNLECVKQLHRLRPTNCLPATNKLGLSSPIKAGRVFTVLLSQLKDTVHVLVMICTSGVVNSRSNIVHLTAHNIDSVFLQAHHHVLFCLLCLSLVRSILEETVNDLFTVRISKSELCCCLSTFTSIHSKRSVCGA